MDIYILENTCWAEIYLWKLRKNSMSVNIPNVMMACYPISEWQLPFSLRMTDWELIQNKTLFAYFQEIKLFLLSKYDLCIVVNFCSRFVLLFNQDIHNDGQLVLRGSGCQQFTRWTSTYRCLCTWFLDQYVQISLLAFYSNSLEIVKIEKTCVQVNVWQ